MYPEFNKYTHVYDGHDIDYLMQYSDVFIVTRDSGVVQIIAVDDKGRAYLIHETSDPSEINLFERIVE